MLRAGRGQVDRARNFHVSQGVISRLWTRFQTTGRVDERPGRGRKRVTSRMDDRYMRMHALQNRKATAKQVQNRLSEVRGVRVSDHTFRNRLHQSALRGRQPVASVPLTPRNRRARLLWSRAHERRTRRQWAPVLFTYERRVNLKSSNARQRVWRRSRERYPDALIQERERLGGRGIMM